jgi:hypothetical protein
MSQQDQGTAFHSDAWCYELQDRRTAADHAAIEIDRRLASALHIYGRSPLGLPGTVDTFKDMLERAGLALVLAPAIGSR